MTKGYIGISILASVFYFSTGLQAATFNVATPTAFQNALTTAQANGQDDTINVSAGTYNIGSTLTYETAENFDLTITGAGAAATILDGGNAVRILRLSGEGNGNITVSGLTMQHGRAGAAGAFGGALFVLNSANGSITIDQCVATHSSSTFNAGGAWLGAVNGDITVTHSSFSYNTCDEGTADDGCGLYLYFDTETASGSAIVRNNVISHNTLNDNPEPIGGCDGAGMMIYHLGSGAFDLIVENNIISDNTSLHGVAGIVVRNPHVGATITINGNTFSGNIAGGTPYTPHPEIPGGAAHIYTDGGAVTINNNKFINNESRGPYDRGAGLCLDNMPEGTFEMRGNVFAGNRGHIGGGAGINLGAGVTGASIVENLFVNNQAGAADGSGGGLSLAVECDVSLINNTFYGNSASDGAGLGFYAESASNSAMLYNDIYWNNTPNSIAVFSLGPVAAQYCNIQGGKGKTYFGAGCIDADPLFFNTASPQGTDGIYATVDDGLHLTAGSPSMNKGSNAAVPGTVTTDIAGQPRIQGGTVDMGAYEGVAGTPTAYSLTMAVSPAGSGTTTPASGTHSVTSPQAITATAAAGFRFVNWTAAQNAAVSNLNASNTTVALTGNGTVTANFAAISATATLTMAASPTVGGSTTPAIGAHTVNTQEAQNITASPANGYQFVNWTCTGNVVVAGSSSSSTTATLTGNGTVTANFTAVSESVNLMFIHHSCGQNWLDNSLRAALQAKSYIDEVNEITYGDVVAPDAGRPGSLGPTPGELTDMSTWLYWFNDYIGSIETFECAAGTNKIIMFKSCFPNSHIEEAGTLPGDPFDATHTIANHEAVFRNAAGAGTAYTNNGYTYYALEDVFAANPDILFIPVTAPPECYADATAATGANARIFNDWLKKTWLPAYKSRTGLKNVEVFDWFDILANANTDAAYANMLQASYGGDSGDSHPNDAANAHSTAVYASGTINFLDLVWALYKGTGSQYALTTAVNPVSGGTTVPVAGTSNTYAPVVISAIAGESRTFLNWTVSLNGLVYNANSPVTTLLMSGAATATANFDGSSSVVFVNLTGDCGGNLPCYSSIQNAVTATETGSVIRIAGGLYAESITLNQSRILTLQGGWNPDFSAQNGTTTLQKAPAAPQGALILQMMAIRP